MFDINLIHPFMVHFTIALFTVVVILDLLGLVLNNDSFHSASWLNLIFAGCFAILTVISGLLAQANVPHNDAAHEVMETHESIGYLVLAGILILLSWRIWLKGKFPSKIKVLFLIIGLVTLGLTFTGAYYGGELVYTHGVAVKAVSIEEKDHSHDHEHTGKDEDLQKDSNKIATKDTISQKQKEDIHVHEDGATHKH